MSDDILKLDNQLCFALYVCSKEIIRQYKPFLDPLGLTYTMYITLMALWEKDNVTVSELGKKLYLDSGTLTPLLKKMEEQGLVKRSRSSKDERTVFITLTDKGKKLKSECKKIPMKMFCSSNLEPDKAALLLQTLHELQRKNTK
jgi:DNA-binding MarR family transcriptional regulator